MLWWLLISTLISSIVSDPSFTINYTTHQFLKDGQPFRYFSGEIHYFRILPELWEDRLMRLKHAGLNAIQVYVPWNFHETFEGQFDFSGNANLTAFLQIAQNQGFVVLLRTGPYICAEWEAGGLPYWLLKKKDLKLRVYNQPFMDAVTNYYNALLPYIKPMLYQNGGSIIMIQVENEYGFYEKCDKKYLTFLRDLIRANLGNDIVLYTTDPWYTLECGTIDGVFATVDFGVSDDANVTEHFELQQKYANGGPIVNSEFYPGWYTLWGQNDQGLPSTDDVLSTMTAMYNANASFSFYMFHGGTNFGFWNGAEPNGALITSYDYGAPVSENGGITAEYLAIQDWMRSLNLPANQVLETPKNNPIQAYGNLTLKKVDSLLISFIKASQKCQPSFLPMSFEDIDHPYGFVMYKTNLTFGGQNLSAPNLKDHGYVYLNGVPQGVIFETIYTTNASKWVNLIDAKAGDTLTIIVENRGRQTFLSLLDPKGLLPNITLDNQVLTNWIQCPINLDSTSSILNYSSSFSEKLPMGLSDSAGIYTGSFSIDGPPADTWVYPGLFSKGQIFINGFNLGRYWATQGPQTTLYIPAPLLKKDNTIVFVELLGTRTTDTTIAFVDNPHGQFPTPQDSTTLSPTEPSSTPNKAHFLMNETLIFITVIFSLFLRAMS